MIEANEFLELMQPDPAHMGGASMKFGTVTAVSSGRPVITFDGETTPSQKAYKRLAAYTPAVNDRVALAPVAGTYLILGKVV